MRALNGANKTLDYETLQSYHTGQLQVHLAELYDSIRL